MIKLLLNCSFAALANLDGSVQEANPLLLRLVSASLQTSQHVSSGDTTDGGCVSTGETLLTCRSCNFSCRALRQDVKACCHMRCTFSWESCSGQTSNLLDVATGDHVKIIQPYLHMQKAN